MQKRKNSFSPPVLQDVYKQKKELRETGIDGAPKIYFYKMHDGKMIYAMTQHSTWGRQHNPFLLCDCNRGAGVKSTSHKCELIPNDKQLYHWNRALRRLNNKLSKGEPYTEKITEIGATNIIRELQTMVSTLIIYQGT